MDILPNRILRTSHRSLLSPRITLDRSVRGKVRSAYRRLDGVSRVRLKRNTFGQVQLGGQRRVYHHLLSVSRGPGCRVHGADRASRVAALSIFHACRRHYPGGNRPVRPSLSSRPVGGLPLFPGGSTSALTVSMEWTPPPGGIAMCQGWYCK